MFASEQVARGIEGEAVGPAAGVAVGLGFGLPWAPAMGAAARDIAEEEGVVDGNPDRAFRKAEAGGEASLFAKKEFLEAVVFFNFHGPAILS